MSTSVKDIDPDISSFPRKGPVLVRLAHRVEDAIDDVNWLHLAFKTLAYTYIVFILWITWQILPFSGHWDISHQSDKLPIVYQDYSNYFGSFEGFSECKIRVSDLYIPPFKDNNGQYAHNAFCPNRKTLLEAMSNGGRIGFDAPYMPKDCHYRWYTVAEICMILERFDGLVLVGDSPLHNIYNGLNILLRQDLALGALKAANENADTQSQCRCENQFIKQSCAEHFLVSSEDMRHPSAHSSDYLCSRPLHALLKVNSSPAPQDLHEWFKRLVPQAPRSHYKPIPIIHSLSPSTVNKEEAEKSLLEFLKLADESQRKTPMLWIGPSAAGHVEVKGRKGNQEIWDFDGYMTQTARKTDIEVLRMWNMTVQAESWDGMMFGEKVAITQAMMVINWLSRLESS